MASIVYNSAVQHIRGKISGFVYRWQKNGSAVVAKAPTLDPHRVPTAPQALQQERFSLAAARCRRLLEDMALKQAYQQIMAGRGSTARLRALVMGDIMKAPKVQAIDLSAYQGAIGDTIRIVAEDNVGIARLRLVIHDNTARLDLETAEKVITEDISREVEWVYTTTAALPDESLNHQVDITVAAYDLAGNEVTSTVSARP